MRLAWIVIAGAFALSAVVLTLKGSYEGAFIVATLGAVSWFLSYRVQMRELNTKSESNNGVVEDAEVNED